MNPNIVTADDFRNFATRHQPDATPGTQQVHRPAVRERGLDTSGLDVVKWFQAHEAYGKLLDEGRGLHSVKCPWEEEHSTGDGKYDSDTTIWDGCDGRLPGFKCMHSHCQGRRLREVIREWGDAEQFGATVRVGREYELTDEGNALRLIDRSGSILRYAPDFGGWMCWREDLGRWYRDINDVEVTELARTATAHIKMEAEAVGDGERRKQMLKWEQQCQKFERRRAQVGAAAKSRELRARSDDFDSQTWMINCRNGVINLKNLEFLPQSPDQLFTKQVPLNYDADAECPRFSNFIREILQDDDDLIDFMWRALGYSITGDTSEQVLFFLHGDGSNGKSSFLDTMQYVLGDYAVAAPPGLLMQNRGDKHPTAIAELRGRRFVACEEVSEGGVMAEETVKQLTGTKYITARMMRQDYFTFPSTHKLWLAANHKPQVKGTDYAIWRRIVLIPFERQFSEGDKDAQLLDKLFAEAPGIFAKICRHAQKVNETGLQVPQGVHKASNEYREEQDIMGQFLLEECVMHPKEYVTACALYKRYKEWAENTGDKPVSQRMMGLYLQKRGLQKHKVSTSRWYGLRLITEDEKLARHGELVGEDQGN